MSLFDTDLLVCDPLPSVDAGDLDSVIHFCELVSVDAENNEKIDPAPFHPATTLFGGDCREIRPNARLVKSFSPRAARVLARWLTARVERMAFNYHQMEYQPGAWDPPEFAEAAYREDIIFAMHAIEWLGTAGHQSERIVVERRPSLADLRSAAHLIGMRI